MDKKRIEVIKKQFDVVVHNHEEVNIQFWYARDLMPLLGYERWENFDKVISRAMDSCENSEIEITDHFRKVTKMVALGSGSKRGIKDYHRIFMNVVWMMQALVVSVQKEIKHYLEVTVLKK